MRWLRTRRVFGGAVLALAAGLQSGCLFLSAPEREYSSNAGVLEELASGLGYVVDPGRFVLVAADVREDSVTLQYKGAEYPGDVAWVVRFSQKSTEQDPDALAAAQNLVPVIAEGRRGFVVVQEGSVLHGETPLTFVRYRFASEVRDDAGEPVVGRGYVVAGAKDDGAGNALVFHIKLDNLGDRDELSWADILPFLDALDS